MKIECKEWQDSNVPALLPIVRKRFDDEACKLVDLFLANPLRSLYGSVGDIVCVDGKIAAFQATILRRLAFNGKEIIGACGSMLCKVDESTPPEAVLAVMQKSGGPQYGCNMYYGNTASPISSKLNRALRAKIGPESWTRFRYCVPHWMALLSYLFKHFVLRKKEIPHKTWRPKCNCELLNLPNECDYQITCLSHIDDAKMASFWSEVKSSTSGLVSSRTPEELKWLFGNRLKNTRCVMLTASKQGKMYGYIILGCACDDAMRWTIADMIALNNDLDAMKALLKAAKRFLRKHTPAMLFEITGFPDFVQPLLKREFPFARAHVPNQFIWKFNDKQLQPEIEKIANTEQSWFFGPYDGDKCMCC